MTDNGKGPIEAKPIGLAPNTPRSRSVTLVACLLEIQAKVGGITPATHPIRPSRGGIWFYPCGSASEIDIIKNTRLEIHLNVPWIANQQGAVDIPFVAVAPFAHKPVAREPYLLTGTIIVQ